MLNVSKFHIPQKRRKYSQWDILIAGVLDVIPNCLVNHSLWDIYYFATGLRISERLPAPTWFCNYLPLSSTYELTPLTIPLIPVREPCPIVDMAVLFYVGVRPDMRMLLDQ